MSNPLASRAPILPQVEKTELESTISLVDVDSSHVAAAPSDSESQPVKTTRRVDRFFVEDFSEAGHEQTSRDKPTGATAREKPKGLYRYKDNPVIILNILLITAVGAGLGVGAYKKGSPSWKVAGLWTGAVGVFTVADYFVSK